MRIGSPFWCRFVGDLLLYGRRIGVLLIETPTKAEFKNNVVDRTGKVPKYLDDFSPCDSGWTSIREGYAEGEYSSVFIRCGNINGKA